MMLATTALIMPITPAAVTVGTPHWTAQRQAQKHITEGLSVPFVKSQMALVVFAFYLVEGTLNN